MKIVINNTQFDYDLGCRLLKSKYKDQPFGNLGDIWNDIQPITFKEIATQIVNIEQRRVAIGCLGLEQITKEVEPTLIDSETISKETTWVTQEGELVNHKFEDTYSLYKIDGSKWADGINDQYGKTDVHFIKFKDTSTDREYMLWVDASNVVKSNTKAGLYNWTMGSNITPIQAIAWSFQTRVIEGGIEKIVRQGDCIMIKKKPNAIDDVVRHLTEQEYRTLLELES
jgi:hypothetical protein